MRDIYRMHLRILGIRGIPASHGGFETFAERLSLYLRDRGWQVTVYCQEVGSGAVIEDQWQGIRRIRMPLAGDGAAATVLFDWKSTLHASGEPGLVLTLGYNTAMFCSVLRMRGITNLINMDGIEWRRQKWGALARFWFWLNERAGCWLGNHLIADHPEIKRHLATRVRDTKITTIPYGAERLEQADPALLRPFDLTPGCYAMVVARPEPENSILEMVRAWSAKFRGCKLMVLGRFDPRSDYAHQVMSAASGEVFFPGAIYDKKVLTTLRYFARVNLHGHRVGGTNPTLVEALGAGNPIIAHDNPFNRWVAGEDAGRYFADEAGCAALLDQILSDQAELKRMRSAAFARHAARFTWQHILREYEVLLLDWARSGDAAIASPVSGTSESEPAPPVVASRTFAANDLLDSDEDDAVAENVHAR